MRYNICRDDKVGLVHPASDAHTLGIASVKSLLEDCGVQTLTAGMDICQAITEPKLEAAVLLLRDWIHLNGLTVLGFSYRLDPQDGLRFFSVLYRFLKEHRLMVGYGGPVKALFFAGLPATCDLVEQEYPELAGLFRGDETVAESMSILGLDNQAMPTDISAGMIYDEVRLRFGRELVAKGEYTGIGAVRRDYPTFGTARDSLMERLDHGRLHDLPPLIRAHVGPYTGDHAHDLKQFLDWTEKLAAAGLLDVLSIGTSQLTQSHFFRDRTGLPDGGGISIESAREFISVWQAARPMLVRTYAGSRDILRLAWMYDECLNMAWHTLSFWWFCQIDGRGPNSVLDNLKEHFSTLNYIASVGKPFEPNVPHHFAFRGTDDVSYIVSGFLAAKAAKVCGVRALVLQVMLNTPKATWGIQDLAKAQSLLRLVRELEADDFRVVLQPRGGLDYFSPNLEKAKAQLAAVTALMDDIEPDDPASPQIIHVVSYSEAVRLADPAVIDESIRLTRHALNEYRSQKKAGKIGDISHDPELLARRKELLDGARRVIGAIEELVPDPYSPEGFYRILTGGFLPVPYLWECREEFAKAVKWQTKLIRGGMQVVDADGRIISPAERMELIRAGWKGTGESGRVIS